MALDKSRSSFQFSPEDHWTEQEKWVWNQACKGEIASFNKRYLINPDPAQNGGWTENRIISPGFIYEVLSRDELKNSLPRTGLRIEGALLLKPLDLHNLILNIELWIDKSRFEKKVDLSYLRTDSPVSFEGSYFEEEISFRLAEIRSIINMSKVKVAAQLNMESVNVGNHVFLSGGSEFSEINLNNSIIRGNLYLFSSRVTGNLKMNSGSVGDTLFLGPNSEYNNIELTCSKINGQLQLQSSRVSGILSAGAMYVGDVVVMGEGSEFSDIDLSSSTVTRAVNMSNLVVKKSLKMTGFKTSNSLLMNNSSFNGNVELIGADIGNQLSIRESVFKGLLQMSQIRIGDSINMEKCTELHEVILNLAEIKSSFTVVECIFLGPLSMFWAKISNYFITDRNCEFSDVTLGYLELGGQCFFGKSTFKGHLLMNSATIGKSFFLRNVKVLNGVNFVRVKIGDQFLMDQSVFTGENLMASILVGENLVINSGKYEAEINLSKCCIEGSLHIYGCELAGMDLSGSKIRNELEIGTGILKNNWKHGALLNLRNTSVGSIHDSGKGNEVWSENLDLNGFVYTFLGGKYRNIDSKEGDEIAERKVEWFIDWLERNQGYSPHPYHHVARVLREMGFQEKSTAILYACKVREKKEALKSGYKIRWLGMSVIDWTIGFGFGPRYLRSLIWVAVLSLLGVIVLYTLPGETLFFDTTGTLDAFHSFWLKLGFSIDRLLPFVWLDERFRFSFGGWQLYYFYFHQLMGFMLGSFVVAGLSGITKK